jgi:hypothetical protein
MFFLELLNWLRNSFLGANSNWYEINHKKENKSDVGVRTKSQSKDQRNEHGRFVYGGLVPKNLLPIEEST